MWHTHVCTHSLKTAVQVYRFLIYHHHLVYAPVTVNVDF